MKSKQRRPPATALGRFIRGRRPDHNPLRRASDVIETVVLAAAIVVFAVAAPFLAQGSASWAYDAGRHAQASQEAHGHMVRATILPARGGQEPTLTKPEAPARWRAPDGRTVTGMVVASPGMIPGDTTNIWTNRDGAPTAPPLRNSQIEDEAILVSTLSVAIFGGLLSVAAAVTRRVLDRRRMAAWDADWRVTGPRWTSHA